MISVCSYQGVSSDVVFRLCWITVEICQSVGRISAWSMLIPEASEHKMTILATET